MNTIGHRRFVRRWLARAGMGLTAMTVATVLGLPAPASASTGVPGATAVGSISCKGTEVLTYSPGLRLFPRTVTLTATANFGPCVSTNPAIASGTAGTPPGGVPANLSCLNLLDSSSGQATVRWNNGTASRYSFNRSSQTVAGQLISTATGTVTAGEFLGRSVVVAVSLARTSWIA